MNLKHGFHHLASKPGRGIISTLIKALLEGIFKASKGGQEAAETLHDNASTTRANQLDNVLPTHEVDPNMELNAIPDMQGSSRIRVYAEGF